jgi:hypothetical protein
MSPVRKPVTKCCNDVNIASGSFGLESKTEIEQALE